MRLLSWLNSAMTATTIRPKNQSVFQKADFIALLPFHCAAAEPAAPLSAPPLSLIGRPKAPVNSGLRRIFAAKPKLRQIFRRAPAPAARAGVTRGLRVEGGRGLLRSFVLGT